jgi:hypothetical protein
MNLSLTHSTQYVIKGLSLSTKSGSFDIKGLFQEINLFDSLLTPCMSGTIVIQDSSNMSSNFLFDGTEFIKMQISKNEDEIAFQKVFRVFKQSERKSLNQNSEVYKLHFISEEYLLSCQQKVARYYNTTYAEAAVRILIDYLKVPISSMKGTFDNTLGIKKIVVPNLSPFDALQWLAKRSIGENKVPGFLFFENILGYNFANVSNLMDVNKYPVVAKINFNPKNLTRQISNPVTDFLGARHFEVIQQYDVIKKIKDGVYAGTFVGFDPITKTIFERPLSFNDHYSLYKSSNPSPTISDIQNDLGSSLYQDKSNIVYSRFGLFRQTSEYIKENDASSVNLEFDTENYKFQRKALFSNLMNQRVKLVMPGNFGLSSGLNVYLNVPKYGYKDTQEENVDKSLYGNYLISSVRHIIRYDKHETIFEAITDSSNRSDRNEMYRSSSSQVTEYT